MFTIYAITLTVTLITAGSALSMGLLLRPRERADTRRKQPGA